MSKDRLTGPGGFIDISSSTPFVGYMCSFTAQGLKVEGTDGTLKIHQEGKVKKFVPEVYEITFSGDEAVKRGQTVLYITERAVFQRTSAHDVIELIEIAPGVDLQKDILDQMEFEPVVSPNLRVMDPRIFKDEKMNAESDFFGSLEDRCNYHEGDHTIYIDLFGVTLNTNEDVVWFFDGLRAILTPLVDAKGPINVVANYEGFNMGKGLEELFGEQIEKIDTDLYKSVKRYTGSAFTRAKLKSNLSMNEWNAKDIFESFDVNGDGTIQTEELEEGFERLFHMKLSPEDLQAFKIADNQAMVNRESFAAGVKHVLQNKKKQI